MPVSVVSWRHVCQTTSRQLRPLTYGKSQLAPLITALACRASQLGSLSCAHLGHSQAARFGEEATRRAVVSISDLLVSDSASER